MIIKNGKNVLHRYGLMYNMDPKNPYEFKHRRSIGFGNRNTALVCFAKGQIEQSDILEENCLKSGIRSFWN